MDFKARLRKNNKVEKIKSSFNLTISNNDITTLQVDAIVNAANSALAGGGGVDGAIHKAAGPKLLEECLQLGRCPTGEAVITQGYNLAAKYVIHAVGPVWWGGEKQERELLASCYKHSLELAVENNIKSIAFPAISCGAYKFPIEEAAKISIDTIRTYCSEQIDSPKEIILVCFDPKVQKAYEQHLKTIE